ncbi:hypothetical protein ACHAXT_007898 [Thalassiosira profunda]
MGCSASRTSDDDRLLFGPDLFSKLAAIKRNDPGARVLDLGVECLNGLDIRAWTRLGQIVGQAAHLDSLYVGPVPYPIDLLGLAGFWSGLGNNASIKRLCLLSVGLGGDRLRHLVPFLVHNPRIRVLDLSSCNLAPDSVDLLSDALLGRSEHILEYLNLSNNPIGDVNMDVLVLALERNRLTSLNLCSTGIGKRSCESLAKLLGSPLSALDSLCIGGNDIDDAAISLLVDALASNTELGEFDLSDNDGITNVGWTNLLKLLCNGSSIDGVVKSNHSILLWYSDEDNAVMENALGSSDDGNLLRASSVWNKCVAKNRIVRRKVLWSHVRGHLNIGASSIPTGVLPKILEWIADDTPVSESVKRRMAEKELPFFFPHGFTWEKVEWWMGRRELYGNPTEYHLPPLPKKKSDAARIASIYRIVRSRPCLYS